MPATSPSTTGSRHLFTMNEFQNFVDMGLRGVEIVVQGRITRIELAPGLNLAQGAG